MREKNAAILYFLVEKRYHKLKNFNDRIFSNPFRELNDIYFLNFDLGLIFLHKFLLKMIFSLILIY